MNAVGWEREASRKRMNSTKRRRNPIRSFVPCYMWSMFMYYKFSLSRLLKHTLPSNSITLIIQLSMSADKLFWFVRWTYSYLPCCGWKTLGFLIVARCRRIIKSEIKGSSQVLYSKLARLSFDWRNFSINNASFCWRYYFYTDQCVLVTEVYSRVPSAGWMPT